MYVMALDASGDAAAVGSGLTTPRHSEHQGWRVDVDHFIRHGVLRCPPPPRSRRVIDTRASRDRADPARKASLALAAAAGIAMLAHTEAARPPAATPADAGSGRWTGGSGAPTPTPRRTAKVWTISASHFGDDTNLLSQTIIDEV